MKNMAATNRRTRKKGKTSGPLAFWNKHLGMWGFKVRHKCGHVGVYWRRRLKQEDEARQAAMRELCKSCDMEVCP